jgi:hypothetical protein
LERGKSRTVGKSKGSTMIAKCSCQHCGGHIEFDASALDEGETRTIACPHCQLETIIRLPPTTPPSKPPKPASPFMPSKVAPPSAQPFLMTIGDIGITADRVITPNGSGPLAGSQWICTDMSRTESKMPALAVVLAIVFAIFCLLGLLFLLMKETKTSGYVEVSVRTGNIYHKVQIPINNVGHVAQVREQVNKAQVLAAMSAR